jgi:CHAT domain-containing protein
LLIVAEGALQYIPFGALPKPVTRDSWFVNRRSNHESRVTNHEPLILDHEVVMLPSASVLGVLRRELSGRQPAAKTVAILADPVFESDDFRVKKAPTKAEKQTEKPPATSLPAPGLLPDGDRMMDAFGLETLERLWFTRYEAEWIADFVPPAGRLKALGFAANRTTATSPDLSQYRIVHFATHGFLNSEHPELSGVVFSLVDEQGQPQDGFLRLHEVYNLKLNADLVVLSACRTALGKDVKGEGLIGLTRGFMYAGAASVVASLWKVEDKATAKLMRRFYQKMLVEGRRPAAALRAAQVAMWQEKKAPYYWAAFVLQGEWK